MAIQKISDGALGEFITECEEILQRVSGNLQAMESGAVTPEQLDALYRDMHTMKGSAFLFGFGQIGALAHALEASLEPMRRIGIRAGAPLIDVCFRSLDLIDRIVKSVREGKSEAAFESEVGVWIPRIVEAASAQFGGELSLFNEVAVDLAERREAGGQEPASAESARAAGPARAAAPVEWHPPAQGATKDKPGLKRVEAEGGENASPLQPEEAAKGESASVPHAGLMDPTVRVQVALLDRLMNLVGELVLVRNQVLQYGNRHEELELLNLSKSLDVVTSDLQGEVMRTRMQPIGNVLTKFQRVVRDLARDLGKTMDITLQGTETELDKTLIEAIKDPLTHIIRNSCDHGIESPEERRKAGKPANGHILVRAFHEGGQVVVEVSDDGRGLDRAKLVAKAVEKGLLSQERAAKLTEREAFGLVFLPGLSTAKQVTSVSGRGVGMDVVKTNIEKIGGSVEVLSILGRGTTTRLKIPLTLAIVPAMLIRCGSQRFAIPQIKLVELVRIEGGTGGEKVEILQGRPVFRLRGELLPLVDLKEVLGHRKPGEQVDYEGGSNVVVLNAEGQIFGLIVDEILDTADIVVKPLSSFLNGLSFFSGATVMGDGSVALILDVVGVASGSHIDTKRGRSDDTLLDLAGNRKKAGTDAQEFLLFRLSSPTPHAIPLCLVHRLEEFPAGGIERSGDQWVAKYRGAILPLLDMDKFLGYAENAAPGGGAERIPVVVIQRTGRSFGLMVKEIQDIVYVEDQIDDTVRDRPGVLGNVIQQSQVIVVVDALGVVETEVARFQGQAPEGARGRGSALDELRDQHRRYKSKKVRVLFAEDVSFFRKQVAKLLLQQGFEVTTAENGAAARKILESAPPDQFNLILSDIEMPLMNGLELARWVRSQERFNQIPMIALTTKFRQSDIDQGQQAGFNLYLEKLNADRLLDGIESVVSA